MNSKEKLMKVKQYIEKLNFKLSNEETLSPNDEKIINRSNTTARQRAKGICKPYLFGHEWMIGKDFSYKEIYPDLYDELDQDLPDPQDR